MKLASCRTLDTQAKGHCKNFVVAILALCGSCVFMNHSTVVPKPRPPPMTRFQGTVNRFHWTTYFCVISNSTSFYFFTLVTVATLSTIRLFAVNKCASVILSSLVTLKKHTNMLTDTKAKACSYNIVTPNGCVPID